MPFSCISRVFHLWHLPWHPLCESSRGCVLTGICVLLAPRADTGQQTKADFFFQKIIAKTRDYAKSIENYLQNPKYAYNAFNKGITPENFLVYVQDLRVDYTSADLQLAQQVLDPQQVSYFNLSPLLQLEMQAGSKIMPSNASSSGRVSNLTEQEETNLQSILKNINDYCKRQGINLPQEISQFSYHKDQ